MKILIVICSLLVCFTSASFYDALDQESSELVLDFWTGMDQASPCLALDSEIGEEAHNVEEDVKSQLALSLREVLAKVLHQVHQSFQKAEEAAKRLMVKAGQLVEKLKEFSGAGEDLLDRIRQRIHEWVREFVQVVSGSSQGYSLVTVNLELDEKNLMENVKQNILERLNLKELVEYVKAKLSKLGELGLALLKVLDQPGALEKLRDLVRSLLPGRSQDYSLQDMWQKVRDFFKDLGVKIADKFGAFASWIKDVASKGWEKVSTQAGKLKELAKTVAAKAGTMSKKAAQQALEFFNEHKAEIGQLAWTAVKAALTAAISSAG